ncbi:MAG: flagellin [Planctomycetaceae bacterium]
MTKINTNVASLRGLRNLGRANKLLDTSLTRLSTGLKINSGKDNPAGLIASETLRSQLTVIEQSISNSNRANNVIATADSALGEISGLLNQVRGLVQEGLNDGALSQSEKEANQAQIDAALNAINRISANTTFAGDKLIDGSKAFRTQLTAADDAKLDDFRIDTAVFAGSSTINVNASIVTAATRAELFTDFVSGGLASATTIEVAGAKGTDVVFLGATSTLDNIETAIDALTDSTGVIASKTAAVYGSTTIASAGSNNDITFTDVRTTNGDNAENITQVLKVEIVQRASGKTLAVSSSSTATELKLTLTLGTSAANATTSTASDVKALINGSAVSSNFVSVTFEGTGAGTVTAADAGAVTPQNVTSGAVDAFLTFRSQNFGSDQFVGINVLQGTLTTTTGSVGGAAASRVEGTDIVARINGQVAQGKGLRATISTAQLGATLAFKSANNTAGETANVTVTGGGSLFQIGQEVSTAGQIGLGIEAVNTARLGGVSGKLFELSSGGGKSLLDVGPTVPGSGLVSIIEESISRVTELRGRLGALQKNVIETNIASLGVALESIAEARSNIVDTDFAAETAALTRAQILSQSGLSVLGIANQTPSQVLSLLG